MDSIELLAREEEFKKLNKQLEKRSVSLMKEIENAMLKKDKYEQSSASSFYINKSNSSSSEATPKKDNRKKIKAKETNSNMSHFDSSDNSGKCDCQNKKNDFNGELEFLYAFISVNVKTGVLPESFIKDEINIESLCKFLSSKVKLQEEHISKLESTLSKKTTLCEGHMQQIVDYETERLKLLNKINNLTSEVAEAKAKAMAIQNRLNEKERQYKELRSESDKLSSEVKRLKSRNSTVEAKHINLEEEVEKLKSQIEVLKTQEKEYRQNNRILTSSHTNAISGLENKIKQLINTIEKQKSLIDNLRQQNSILSMDAAVKVLEKEFLDLITKD